MGNIKGDSGQQWSVFVLPLDGIELIFFHSFHGSCDQKSGDDTVV